MSLSSTTRELLGACFSQEDQRRALAERLQSDTAEVSDKGHKERILFSIIRLIYEKHQLNVADTVFQLAQTD